MRKRETDSYRWNATLARWEFSTGQSWCPSRWLAGQDEEQGAATLRAYKPMHRRDHLVAIVISPDREPALATS